MDSGRGAESRDGMLLPMCYDCGNASDARVVCYEYSELRFLA